MGTKECSQSASKSSWDSQDFGDVRMVLKWSIFASPPGHNELKSTLVNKDFQTWLLIGCWLCCQPIKWQVWKYFLINMEDNAKDKLNNVLELNPFPWDENIICAEYEYSSFVPNVSWLNWIFISIGKRQRRNKSKNKIHNSSAFKIRVYLNVL